MVRHTKNGRNCRSAVRTKSLLRGILKIVLRKVDFNEMLIMNSVLPFPMVIEHRSEYDQNVNAVLQVFFNSSQSY